jgi:hypothetical protein
MITLIVTFGIGIFGLLCIGKISQVYMKKHHKPKLNLYDVLHGITPKTKAFFLGKMASDRRSYRSEGLP